MSPNAHSLTRALTRSTFESVLNFYEFVCVCVDVCAGLRGQTANVVIMEEAAFMKEEVFLYVIVPLMSVQYTVVLSISTPEDDQNFYSVLLSKKDDSGMPLFRVLPIGLACESCQKSGKAADCPHNRDQLPSWKSTEAQKLQKRILPPEVYQTEALGLIVSRKRYAFNKPSIERTFTQNRIRVCDAVGVVYIMVDPSGNGSGKSDLALIAFVLDAYGNHVVSFFCFNSYFREKKGEHEGRGEGGGGNLRIDQERGAAAVADDQMLDQVHPAGKRGHLILDPLLGELLLHVSCEEVGIIAELDVFHPSIKSLLVAQWADVVLKLHARTESVAHQEIGAQPVLWHLGILGDAPDGMAIGIQFLVIHSAIADGQIHQL